MRTTLTLDDDVALLLREEAKRTGRPFKQVLNESIRLGFRVAAPAATRERFQVEAYPFQFQPGLDLDKATQLADELEAQAFAERYLRTR